MALNFAITFKWIVLAYCVLWNSCLNVNGARILGFFLAPSKSHLILHSSVAEVLAEAGHDVTVVATQPNIKPKAKYRYLQIPIEMFSTDILRQMINEPKSKHWAMFSVMDFINDISNKTLNQPEMKKFLATHGPGDFDLIIFGYFFNDFLLGVAGHFRCPIIISDTLSMIPGLSRIIGNPIEPSYVPVKPFSNLIQPMDTIWLRAKNFAVFFMETALLGPFMRYMGSKYYEYNFPAPAYPTLSEVYRNVSLIFIHHHSLSEGPIAPLLPSVIEIGGLHMKEKPEALPNELSQFLDKAKINGVIYVSFGSLVMAEHFTSDKEDILFEVLGHLPYSVVMKWNNDSKGCQLPNIYCAQWMPQVAVLAHPKVVLFVTHAGHGGVVESMKNGVPMVAMPLYAEQEANAKTLVDHGYGVSISYHQLTVDLLRSSILEVLQKPSYRAKIKHVSKLYNDRLNSPRQLVTYWTDYVLRHQGAKHLQSPAIYLTWWQLLSLDVIALILVILFIVIYTFVWLVKCLCCRGGKNKEQKSSSRSSRSKKHQ